LKIAAFLGILGLIFQSDAQVFSKMGGKNCRNSHEKAQKKIDARIKTQDVRYAARDSWLNRKVNVK